MPTVDPRGLCLSVRLRGSSRPCLPETQLAVCLRPFLPGLWISLGTLVACCSRAAVRCRIPLLRTLVRASTAGWCDILTPSVSAGNSSKKCKPNPSTTLEQEGRHSNIWFECSESVEIFKPPSYPECVGPHLSEFCQSRNSA